MGLILDTLFLLILINHFGALPRLQVMLISTCQKKTIKFYEIIFQFLGTPILYNRSNKTFPGTPKFGKKKWLCAIPIMFLFYSISFQKRHFRCKTRIGYINKASTFYYIFHNYQLSKASAASKSDIFNFDITDGALRATPAESPSFR